MASISSTGVGSGLDVNTIVSSLMSVEKRPLSLLQTRASEIQTKISAFGSLTVFAENLAAARGRIMDADFAAETANLSRAQILQQAGTAMVAQANQLPQQVLSLLKG